MKDWETMLRARKARNSKTFIIVYAPALSTIMHEQSAKASTAYGASKSHVLKRKRIGADNDLSSTLILGIIP